MPWLVANHRDFDPEELATAKRRSGHRVSVCLPARDEEATVGHIVTTVRRHLVERIGLVDEVVVVDDGSVDATPRVAADAGARVVTTADVLPEAGPGSGKGNALWLSLFAAEGDLLCWLDADVRNFEAHFVTGLLGPLLASDEIALVKGFYRRPLHGDPTGGGRVTELVARPVLSLLFPPLARIVQPLAGEYAGRREVLERIPFVEGWGVELGLLLDIAELAGIESIAQVDLGVREHDNRPLGELGPQALAVLAVALRRAGHAERRVEATELVRFTTGHRLERVPVETRERPPMLSLPAYRSKLGRELSA